ncbi:TPA: (2Fe-2S)-binding protein [Clostridioides difficile]
MEKEKCSCCDNDISTDVVIGEYVCYCNHVKEEDIKDVILKGAKTIQEVIKATGAMKNSNCAVNNPKGTCCYSDIVFVFNKYKTK